MDSSKGPPRKNRQKISIFLIFPAYGKNGLRWPQIGPGGFFSTNLDLANILGRTDLNFENFYFFDFLDPKFLDFQVPRFPDAAAADSAAAAADGRTLRSQPDPSPNAPRDQIRRKGPCCDDMQFLTQFFNILRDFHPCHKLFFKIRMDFSNLPQTLPNFRSTEPLRQAFRIC